LPPPHPSPVGGGVGFLHQVANGGGTIEREYAIGRNRMDLCLCHRPDVLSIELKVWRDQRTDPLESGLEQLDGYLARLGLTTGWLIISDQRHNQPPIAERTQAGVALSPGGRSITVIRA